MPKSTELGGLLQELSTRAQVRGLSDSAWAAAAGIPKETLSRLRRRTTCDLQTLSALAAAVDARLTVLDERSQAPDSELHFPATIDREYEEHLVELAASGTLDHTRWRRMGPAFFMAGVAVMMASMQEFDRRGLLALAEQLHPGASEPAVFNRWLAASPLRPSRFLPLVEACVRNAA